MKEIKTQNIKLKANKTYITLNELLKLLNIINTGGMAKIFLSTNEVFINDEKEIRRGRKLYHNDKILINGAMYIID